MRNDCQFRVRSVISGSMLIAVTITAIACSEATAPIVAKKYIVTTSKSTALPGETIIVKAQLVDADDHPVKKLGKTVSWYYSSRNGGHYTSATSVTDDQGVASNYFVVGTKANFSVTLFVLDIDQLRGDAPPIAVIAGPPSVYQVTPSTTSAPVSATISLSAQLMDNFGNPISLAGRIVTWSIATGTGSYYQRGVRSNRLAAPGSPQRSSTTGGTLSSPTSTTNSQGLATVDFTVGTTISASYVIVATDDQAITGTSPPISVQAGPIAKFVISVMLTDPPAGAPVVLTTYPVDSYGNRINQIGLPVSWSVTGAGGTLSAAVTNTGPDGNTANVLTTGTTQGVTYTVTASGSNQSSGTSPAITTLEQVALASVATGIGSVSSCGIAISGAVWCWGSQNATLFPPRPLPGKPIGDQSMSALTNGPSHSCGISGGIVMCWGLNDAGQLGDNTRTSRAQPAPISSALSFTAVSAGSSHTCALATTGDIYCWGSFDSGRLGDGTGFTGLGPVKVGGGLSFVAVSAGDAHTCAIAASGDAYCWGSNAQAQLGNGTVATASAPILVSGGLKFTAIAAGNSHTCGISSGAIYCWGDNTFGELGNGTVTPQQSPTAVRSTSKFVSVAAGGFNTCAIASDARAFCWGSNAYGEAGDLNFVQSKAVVPIAVTGGLAFQSIAVGGSGSISGDYYYGPYAEGHSCGVTTSGVAYCWGSNSGFALGVVPGPTSSATPLKVSGQH